MLSVISNINLNNQQSTIKPSHFKIQALASWWSLHQCAVEGIPGLVLSAKTFLEACCVLLEASQLALCRSIQDLHQYQRRKVHSARSEACLVKED